MDREQEGKVCVFTFQMMYPGIKHFARKKELKKDCYSHFNLKSKMTYFMIIYLYIKYESSTVIFFKR